MTPYCRHCGSAEKLTLRFGITVCEPCRLDRIKPCLDCRKRSPEVVFRRFSERRCVGCNEARRVRRPPAKAKAPKKKAAKPGVNNAHLWYIRSQPCIIGSPECAGVKVHAHHVRTAATSGTGMRPDDRWTIPLCARHHIEGHTKGWVTFAGKYGIDLRAKAKLFAALSPHLIDESTE